MTVFWIVKYLTRVTVSFVEIDKLQKNVKKDGGGVLIAIKKCFNVICKCSWETDLEDIWITILSDSANKRNFNICLSYLPSYISIDTLTMYYENCQKLYCMPVIMTSLSVLVTIIHLKYAGPNHHLTLT